MITTSEAKTFLQISGSTYDAQIALYIDLVTAEIEAYIDNKILITSVTDEVLDVVNSSFDLDYVPTLDTGRSSAIARTRYSPIITASGVSLTDGDETLVSGTDFLLDDETGIIEFLGSVDEAQNNLKIDYVAGFETVPNTLKAVAYQGVKDYFVGGGVASQRGGAIKSKKVGDFAVSYADGSGYHQYISENKMILDRYRRVGI